MANTEAPRQKTTTFAPDSAREREDPQRHERPRGEPPLDQHEEPQQREAAGERQQRARRAPAVRSVSTIP